jgi:hypothetical protein
MEKNSVLIKLLRSLASLRRSERYIEDRYSLLDSNIKKRINRNRNGNRNRIKK